MYKCMRTRTQIFDRSEKYFQGALPWETGEAGPVMQWWWIYTTSFALKPFTLSAVQKYLTSSSFPEINKLETQTQQNQ